jgi:hypothetical protein
MGGGRQHGGIDERSTADDVRDALASAGLDLHVRERPDGGAEAAYTTAQGGGELNWVAGGSPDEAARIAWARYLDRQGGHGVS